MNQSTKKILKISEPLISTILHHCENEKPYEACGILAGKNYQVLKIFPARNIERSPTTYRIDPAFYLEMNRQARSEGMDIVGVYHSHPTGFTGMSQRDIALGWENFFYLIVSFEAQEVRLHCFQIKDDKAVEVKIQRI
ncbi:MAG: M67 family metallopeptidase [bacterium]